MITHLVLEGVAESSLGVGLDAVGTASRLVSAGLVPARLSSSALRQRVVSIDGRPVRAGSGRLVPVDGALQVRALGPADVVVVPGIFAATERSIARALARDDVVRAGEVIQRAAARGGVLAASCSATFVVAAAGLLDGRAATTTWWLAPEFARRFPAVELTSERMVVDAGQVLTAGSAFAHADLMLAILSRIGGAALAQGVARYLVLDERPSQARYMVLEHLRVSDPAMQVVERYVAENVHRQVGVDELARVAAMSSRTLARRIHAAVGMTPLELVHRVRVRHAANLLETTRASVEEVAAQVGYADAAAFRRVFRRYSGESPRGVRSRRSGADPAVGGRASQARVVGP